MTDKMMFIEGEGGLFRGYCEDIPSEIWHPGSGWQHYTGGPKQRYWGSKITEDEAKEMMADLAKWEAIYKEERAARRRKPASKSAKATNPE